MKQYVDVITYIDSEARLRPLVLVWNGRRYSVDHIFSVRELYAADGGCGVRYLCLIAGRRRSLWWERDRWFVQTEGDNV